MKTSTIGLDKSNHSPSAIAVGLLSYYKEFLLILFLGIILLSSDYLSVYPGYSWVNLLLFCPFGLLYGPFLELITKSFLKQRLSKQYVWSFVPFVFFGTVYFISTTDFSLYYQYRLEVAVFAHFFSLLYLGSFILAIRFSFLLEGWTSKLYKSIWNVLFLALFIVQMIQIYTMVVNQNGVESHKTFILFQYLFFLFGIITILVLIRNNSSSVGHVDTLPVVSLDPDKGELYAPKQLTTVMSGEQLTIYRSKAEYFIQTLLYLDSDLNKAKFSEMLEIPEQHVTPFLKSEFGYGFNKFVNHLRLQYAVRLLKSGELIYNIDELAFVCGFNSRASFYRNFQVEFGCSPHQFRQTKLNQR